MIKVSIITVVLNQEKLIQRAIDSVCNQSYKNIEHILIDGGSEDGTVDIIRKNQEKITRWISEGDDGISDAFNKGLKLCNGELIGIINADDWYEPQTIEKVVSQFEKGDIFYGNIQFWKKEKKSYLYSANHEMLTKEMTINHPTVFVKKELYDQHGVFNTDFKCAMDYELLLRMYCNGVQFFYIDELLANMQMEGISHQKWKLGYKEVKKAKNLHLGKQFAHQLWYYKQIGTIYTIQFLKQIGLNRLIQYYRAKFAPIKKTITEV